MRCEGYVLYLSTVVVDTRVVRMKDAMDGSSATRLQTEWKDPTPVARRRVFWSGIFFFFCKKKSSTKMDGRENNINHNNLNDNRERVKSEAFLFDCLCANWNGEHGKKARRMIFTPNVGCVFSVGSPKPDALVILLVHFFREWFIFNDSER